MDHRLPHRFAYWPQQKNLGGRPVVAHAEEAGAENAGSVEDEGVAGRDQLLEIAELLVRDLSGRSVYQHQATLAAPLAGELRDTIDWQLEIVV